MSQKGGERMTSTPVGTKLVLKYLDGKSYTLSKIKNGLADASFFNTAISVTSLQESTAKSIYRVEDTELADE
jgi:TnpA family transposase